MKTILTTAAALAILAAPALAGGLPDSTDRCEFYKAPNGNYMIRAGAECGAPSSAGDYDYSVHDTPEAPSDDTPEQSS